ncbi:MAG: DUF1844 domain-containing protein [Phycisphaerae bacterium]|nr:DUF1844 domain-containing protein [Phycisphaerae bacterium]
MAEQPGGSKIIVDSDWKSQAQAEKERLAANERADKEKLAAKGGPAAAGAPGDSRELPPADFTSVVGTLVTQALMYLGGFPDPQTGRAVVSLEYARFHIDLLTVLQEKTKGNLAEREAQDLTEAIYELQMRYVQIGKMIASQALGKGPAAGVPGAEVPGPLGT